MLRPLFHLLLGLLLALAPTACLANDPHDPLEGDSETETEADEPPTWHSLVRNDAWRADNADGDPRIDHRPATVACEHGWYAENGGIEVDTGACNYLSLQQLLLDDLEPGDPVRLQLWWQSLASVDPAEAHLAVFVDDALLWEEHVPIPGLADARNLEFESPVSAPAGATVTLHLHNHGYNTWHFHELYAFSDPSCPSCDDTNLPD